MDAEQARRVLGLQSDDDWAIHESSFQAARQQMADLVRQSPTEAMEQRYQEGLMEFDRALAFYRELKSRPPEPSQEADPALRTFEAVAETLAVDEPEEATATVTATRSGSRGVLWLFLLVLAVGASWFGLREWHNRQESQRQLQVAQWETDAADHLSKRRWQDALVLYQNIEALERNSDIAVKGRRSIEAGMVEEQEQYLGYWAGEAIAAFEGSRWDEAKAAIAKVMAVQPRHEEMKALAEKITFMQSAGLRQQWKDQAQAAMDQRQWLAALPWIEKILQAEPQNETAIAWKSTAEQGIQTERDNQRRAEELYQQARGLDQGRYNPQLLDLVSQAKKLAPKDQRIAELYEKVANYGRTMRVPQEYPQLQAALDAARANDRIVIEPGLYEGSFVVNVVVLLEAASGEVILSCPAENGPALTLRSEVQGAKVSGIHFRHSTLVTESERYSAVLVAGAKVSFESCHFQRAAGHGMAVIQGGEVSIEQCRFEENGWDGISVQENKSQAQIRNSVFLGNIHHGIEVWNQATAVIENNRCADNCLNGILIDTKAAVTVKANQLSSNRDYGIVLRAAGGGVVEGNRMAENLLGGMVVGNKAKAVSCVKNVFGENVGPSLSLGEGLVADSYAQNQFPSTPGKSIRLNMPVE
jgi:parallel beta-helix repeat protein